MANITFYNSPVYKQKQSVITKANWRKGLYDFRYRRERRQCDREECNNVFEVQRSDKKKFCSCSCAAKVNNSKHSIISQQMRDKMQMRDKIEKLYKGGLSMQEISDKTGWSYHQVTYWMDKYNILRRNRSEANYIKYNPNGDPFKIKKFRTKKDFEIFNLGLGLFLGEGGKRNKHNVVLANTDPKILKLFLKFLREICGVNETKIKTALNIFDDVDLKKAINFWSKATGVPLARFSKTMVRKSRGGSYKNKSPYGTLTIYVSNVKLKALMDEWCQTALTHHL